MSTQSVYNLPLLLNKQYMLTAVLRETADTVVYAATQQDMRRDVAVESLRPECMDDPIRVQRFLETARAQTRMGGKFVATTLELVQAQGSWHLVRERIQGEPLDELIAAEQRVSAAVLCDFMLCLCRNCIVHDMQGVATLPFSLQNAFFMGLSFRLDNLAIAGERDPRSSCHALQSVARDLQPLVDMASPMADDLLVILRNILRTTNWKPATVLDVHEDFVRLQLLLMQLNAKL